MENWSKFTKSWQVFSGQSGFRDRGCRHGGCSLNTDSAVHFILVNRSIRYKIDFLPYGRPGSTLRSSSGQDVWFILLAHSPFGGWRPFKTSILENQRLIFFSWVLFLRFLNFLEFLREKKCKKIKNSRKIERIFIIFKNISKFQKKSIIDFFKG